MKIVKKDTKEKENAGRICEDDREIYRLHQMPLYEILKCLSE